MNEPTNPSFDLAHLGYVEMLTDRFQASLEFFTLVYGLKLSGQAWGLKTIETFHTHGTPPMKN